MYNCNTDSLGLILGVEVFFSEGHCSGALWIVTTLAHSVLQLIFAEIKVELQQHPYNP